MGYAGNGKTTATPVFNRSVSVHSLTALDDKPSYNFPIFQRLGSVKSSHTSSSFHGKVKKLCSIFESQKRRASDPPIPQHPISLLSPSPSSTKTVKSSSDPPNSIPKHLQSSIKLPGTEDRVVIYFTSLRGIRRTFQDCHSVRMIFRGFRVNIDERDISMDVAYKKELQKLLGGNGLTLPQVFIKGNYIGGADLIKNLVEVGELAKLLKGLPLRAMHPCGACDDARFIPCTNCNGSRKVFDEEAEQARRCDECNENGLLRCPLCCL